MGTDFAPFPLGVSFHDDSQTTISFVNPNKQLSPPKWGKECWWTDPPPAHCEPNFCPISPTSCSKMPGGLDLMSDALNFGSNGAKTGKVVKGTDLDDFPPHLIPLIKTLDQLAKHNGVDLMSGDFSGITLTLHK